MKYFLFSLIMLVAGFQASAANSEQPIHRRYKVYTTKLVKKAESIAYCEQFNMRLLTAKEATDMAQIMGALGSKPESDETDGFHHWSALNDDGSRELFFYNPTGFDPKDETLIKGGLPDGEYWTASHEYVGGTSGGEYIMFTSDGSFSFYDGGIAKTLCVSKN